MENTASVGREICLDAPVPWLQYKTMLSREDEEQCMCSRDCVEGHVYFLLYSITILTTTLLIYMYIVYSDNSGCNLYARNLYMKDKEVNLNTSIIVQSTIPQ